MTKKATAKRLEEIRQEIDLINAEQELRNIKGNNTRSRSVTVGTAFGGVTEVSMRGSDATVLWCYLQPVEVMELIHQLAANIGCHINVQPRDDFASWRNWRNETALGHNPRNSDMHPPQISTKGNSEYETALLARSDSNEQAVATQETVGRKRTKRAATAA